MDEDFGCDQFQDLEPLFIRRNPCQCARLSSVCENLLDQDRILAPTKQGSRLRGK